MRNLPSSSLQRGQALLIILLIMAVGLTVVLSTVSRSVTDISVTTYEEESLRAFSAAEAGIEEALLQKTVGNPPPVDVEPGVTYDLDITDDTQTGKQFRYPKDLVSGEVATFYLASVDPNGDFNCSTKPCFTKNLVNICWGDPGSPTVPAIEIMYYYDLTAASTLSNDFSSLRVKRYAIDRSSRGFFTPPNVGGGCNFSGDLFQYRHRINVNNNIGGACSSTVGCSIVVKVRMYYAQSSDPQKVGIWSSGPSDDLPSQGFIIDSVGEVGESTRRINVLEGIANNPNFFDAAVFSAADLIK